MAKVQIMGYRPRLEATLETLYGLAAIEVIDVRDELGLPVEPVTPAEPEVRRADELRHLRTRLDSLIRLVPGPTPEPGIFEPETLPALGAELDQVAPSVEASVRRSDELRAEHAALPRHIESLRRLLPLLPEIVELKGYETIALLLDRRFSDLLDLLRSELDEMVGTRYHLSSTQVDPERLGAVIVFPRSESARIQSWLSREQVTPVRLPTEFVGLSLPQALAAMEDRLRALPDAIAAEQVRLEDLIRPPLPRWIAARGYVEAHLAQYDAARRVGTTGHAFVVAGWIARPRLPELRRCLERDVGKDVLVVEVPIKPEERDRVPLALSNPAPAEPFEFLIRLLGLPRYGTTDPTLLTMLFLPIFFGLMVGDVVYGLTLGVLAVLMARLGRRSSAWKDLCRILLLGSIWAVVWGFVFGEALGNLGREAGLRPLWFDREQAIGPFLLFSVAIGVGHVVLGLLLGVWVAWRSSVRQTLLERVGVLISLMGLFLLAGAVADRLPAGMATLGIGAVVVGLVLLIYVEGALGFVLAPLEVIGAVTNILSYLRLAALGLASVFLARVANELGGATGPLWVGMLIAVLLHALNVVLAAFSPTIQAIRLHYVEFFGKFYETGGRAFQPLGESGGDALRTPAGR
jgi:V/A-type H+-transporting ATPase subunit I